MKVIKQSTLVEFPKTLEEGFAKDVCDKPYIIERIEYDGMIIWYGYNTNWKYHYDQWYKLVDMEFVPCEIPEYERLYQLNKK